ncbi:receptor-like protein 6 [Quercus suber]|uniref:Receptor-like protein 6 n=1 Tax=Quercus suber TaxID=58331 RepID=A0AAW0KS04_QUESU
MSFLSKTNGNATLNNVEVLELGSCNLRHFPDILHNQTRLLWLDLSDNNIHGQIPKWVMNISEETTVVNFSYNLLTGFDQSMVNFPWPQLQMLDLSGLVIGVVIGNIMTEKNGGKSPLQSGDIVTILIDAEGGDSGGDNLVIKLRPPLLDWI